MRTKEIIDRLLQVGIGWGGPRSFSLVDLSNKAEEQARGRRSAARVQTASQLESEIRNDRLPWQLEAQPLRLVGKTCSGARRIEQCHIAYR